MRKVIAFSILFFLIFIESIHSQCSMCRAVIESEEGQATAKGINDGIVYLMAIPYILVAIDKYAMDLSRQNSRRNQ